MSERKPTETGNSLPAKIAVSVVIPAINERAAIAAAVRSAWTAGASEVIVVDGGSADGTPHAARAEDARVIQGPVGRAVQQNAGAEIASGDVLLFLHADSTLGKYSIQQVKDAVASGTTHGAFRQVIDHRSFTYRILEFGNDLRVRWMQMPYGDQGIFVERNVFRAVGGFPATSIMEDVMICRLLQHHGRARLLDGPIHVSARRWQKHGPVRQTLRNWRLLAAYKLGAHPDKLAKSYTRHDIS